ncbi:hypothetical protein Ae201684P_015748 [Aphanomyces euteiches]|nr:hypothetical protein Ae201684P_015748 [Aphanomyces euteiches]
MPLSVSAADLVEQAQLIGTTAEVLAKLAWATTIRKYIRTNDTLFYQRVSNRALSIPSASRALGPFTTTVPCRIQFDESFDIREMIRTVHDQHISLASHAHSIGTAFHDSFDVEAGLLDTLFEFESVSPPSSGVDVRVHSNDYAFELRVVAADSVASCKFDPQRMPRKQASFVLNEFNFTLKLLLDTIVATRDISSLWQVSPEQEDAIRLICRGSTEPLPFDLLHHAFERQVLVRPTACAVEFEEKQLTYAELNAHANTIANRLAFIGVQANCRVAVIMERSLEFTLGMVAVLKAGGSIMPLDATFPPNRLTYMLKDAGAVAILTAQPYHNTMESLGLSIPILTVNLVELTNKPESYRPSHATNADDEAYIVYTSGSTGKPKGVPVLHKSAVNTAECSNLLFPTEGRRVLQFLAIGFDMCQWDTWVTLSYGGTLVLRTSDAFESLAKVDMVMLVPTVLSLVGHPREFPNLQFVAVSGEPMPAPLAELWSNYVTFIEGYGPTETCQITHFEVVFPGQRKTLGFPFKNVTCYVLDEQKRIVPMGAVGEIYLGGVCVSPFYVNLPEQTAERFVDDPFEGGIMFRSGDMGRLLPNGKLDIAGRVDNQVKVKGYRIELDEVSQAMKQHPDVLIAVALVKNKNLVGYYSPSSVNADAIRDVVARQLPASMIPAIFVGLDSMPQNSNGKVDKKALEAIDVQLKVKSLATDVETRMAQVWAEVLGISIDEIGRDSSFYALGGDSISAIRLVSKAKSAGFVLTTVQVLKTPVFLNMVSAAKFIECVDELDVQILAQEKSLNLINGPVYAATVFQTEGNVQLLHLTIHHLLVDLVSYRILINDLQSLLEGKQLDEKSMSFKEWSEQLTIQSTQWDPALWDEYMYDDVIPTTPRTAKVSAKGILDEHVSSKLSAANHPYGTNVQDLALAALTLAYAQLKQEKGSIEGYCFPLMLEGHGREPWHADLDISSTIGWFTSIYPIVFTATLDIDRLLRQVKQKLRSVPHGGISYGAIKYLAPMTDATRCIKCHRRHNIMFNYAGLFQEMNSASSLFDVLDVVKDVLGEDEPDFSAENIFLYHKNSNLVIEVSLNDNVLSAAQVQSMVDLWVEWMAKIVDYCLDTKTVGGRIHSDVPLLASNETLQNAEAEILSTLHLRPVDVADMYPATPLQTGLVLAMVKDPTEYVLQNIFDIRGDLDFENFKHAWHKLSIHEPLLRTVFVSTISGMVQVVTKEDFSTWTMLEGEWREENLEAQTKQFLLQDRENGFLLSNLSYHRFTGIQINGMNKSCDFI